MNGKHINRGGKSMKNNYSFLLLFILLLSIFIFSNVYSPEKIRQDKNLSITGIVSSISAVDKNSDNLENQKFKYTVTLSNSAEDDIRVEAITPVLSKSFLSKVKDKNVTLKVNQTIKKNRSLNVSGEIIFNTKGLEKKDILNLRPFVKEVKITEERVIKKSF